MSNELFKTKYVNGKPGSGELFAETLVPNTDTPVVCLGMEFPNDQARREYFTEKLREKLKDPEFRKIEGFPIGEDEDILALSDPPYYCACPNPWINDFIQEWEKEKPPKDDLFHYVREPFAADVSEGKNDPIYNAHSYHTKVPHKAIMRYILHYTEPGDIVFDGFCGTGMTGVAAQMCGNIDEVRSLGYKVDGKGNIFDPESEFGMTKPISKLGARKAILNDLSSIATFISSNYNNPVNPEHFEDETNRLLDEIQHEYGWMYETQHVSPNGKPVLDSKGKPVIGVINYVVWSDIFICPNCSEEINFFRAAYDINRDVVRDKFRCPHCNMALSKKNVTHAHENYFDPVLNKIIQRNKQVPSLINYHVGKKRHIKAPDSFDFECLKRIEKELQSISIPNIPMMHLGGENWGEIWRSGYHFGITHAHHFYTARNLIIVYSAWRKTGDSAVRWAISSILNYVNKKQSFTGGGGGMPGVLYIASLTQEKNFLTVLQRKAKSLKDYFYIRNCNKHCATITTQSTTDVSFLPSNSIDYVFVDPPFGSNIMYSEGSFLWESLLQIWTNSKTEAIESSFQHKSIPDYRFLMTACFSLIHRVLRPGRWITIEFSNTQAAVWNGIVASLTDAGFVIADVSVLDKKQGGFKSVTTTTAVKQDLAISAYKPNGGFEERFIKEVDSEEGVWDFVRTHLKCLPVAKVHLGKLVTVGERDPRILFDQLVAYYVRKGYNVPISSQDFQHGLSEHFVERDGLFFLPEQATEYDKKKASAFELVTDDLFVSDEASAIAWLRKQLKEKTMTFQEINPLFMQELSAWNKHEKTLELSQLLEENFLCYDGNGDVPSQIHTYLSTNWHNFRELSKDDPLLVDKARNRWYVPDPNKAGDLEKVREKSLLKEFEQYRNTNGRLKTFRLEAVRAGFKHAYQERDYATILAVGKKIPQDVLEEDEKLLMWFEQAEIRLEK